MTHDELQACTRKQLADMARRQGIADWHGLRKDDLVTALVPKPVKKPIRKNHAPVQPAAARNTSNTTDSQAERAKFDVGVPTRELSSRMPNELPAGYGKDRIVAMVRDPFWIHCYWELTQQALARAEAALGLEWHNSKPILRVLDVTGRDGVTTSERVVRDIEIHGGSKNWYIDVTQHPVASASTSAT